MLRDGTPLAAIDLGSNSFRLEIGRYGQGQIVRTEYLKETVRQGAGLDSDHDLDDAAMQRGWACLARFGERLRGFPTRNVRAVATQTLREAKNRQVFLDHARELLGYPIEVISGREEARLIYSGVSHLLPVSDERRLVVDIGGRSTEMILGQGFEPFVAESYRVGSVGLSMLCFGDGRLNRKHFREASVVAQSVLEESLDFLSPPADNAPLWDMAYGSSGTVGAVADVLAANGVSDGAITRAGLEWLVKKLVHVGSTDALHMPGLKPDRRDVVGGGISILLALFETLPQLQVIKPAQGALRQGVLFELAAREQDENASDDMRSRTVARLARTFGVDTAQATRVKSVALSLFDQASPSEDEAGRDIRQLLGWAAELHEIGRSVSHSDFHRHSAYIMQHADAAGFTRIEQDDLTTLLLAQRGGLRKVDPALEDTPRATAVLCLRLAIRLCHARRSPEGAALALSCAASARTFTLVISSDWAAAHPQSMYLLDDEIHDWGKTGWSLSVRLTAG